MKAAFIRFARWLRSQRSFPTLLPVYLLPGEHVRTIHGEFCSASFFAPDSRADAPYIRVATGDYPALRRKRGRDNALAAMLASFAHELVHYEQWLSGASLNERGVTRRAARTVQAYAASVRRP